VTKLPEGDSLTATDWIRTLQVFSSEEPALFETTVPTMLQHHRKGLDSLHKTLGVIGQVVSDMTVQSINIPRRQLQL
jgi:hypothetical protein